MPLNLIPLTEEIIRALMERDYLGNEEKSGSGSDTFSLNEIKRALMEGDYVSSEEKSGSSSEAFSLDCIKDLIRHEVRKYLTEIKLSDSPVNKTKIKSPSSSKESNTNFIFREVFNENKIKSTVEDDATDDGSEDLENKQREALNELENAFLGEQDLYDSSKSCIDGEVNQSKACPTDSTASHDKIIGLNGSLKSSVQIMFTMTNNLNDDSASSGRDSEHMERITYPKTVVKHLDSRITVLEMKLSTIQKILKKIEYFAKSEIKASQPEKTTDGGDSTLNSLDIRIKSCIESEIGAIEANVQKALFGNSILPRILSDTKINPYDELYYEWRQYRMNLLHYQKSQRSLKLNERPQLEQFIRPPCQKLISSTRIKRRPGFLITPSRTKYNKSTEVSS